MVNVTTPYSNMTLFYKFNLATENMRIFFLALILPTFGLYLVFVTVILIGIFFTIAQIRENVRYLLFSHMLISDTLQLSLAFILFIASIYIFYMPVRLCCVIAAISTTSTLITPYNLALMSLERYVAICHPLRHGEICTAQRCNVAIILTWVVGAIPVLTELILLAYYVDRRFFSLKMVCVWKYLEKYPVQVTIRFLTISLSFSLVGLTIIYTYIRVMLVAQKIGSNKSSASKARNTVLIHGFQLLLCLSSFSSAFTESLIINHYIFFSVINFFLFICLPQYISPLVYGIRDEVIQRSIRKFFFRV